MTGLDATTGQYLSDLDHLKQSIKDLLTTRIGTRVQRRDYGSRLPDLVDTPVGPNTRIEFIAATAEALDQEPRVRLTRVAIVSMSDQGHLVLDLEGVYLHDGQDFRLEGIQIERA